MKKEKDLYLEPELLVTRLCAESFICTSPSGGVNPSEEEEDGNEWPSIN